MDPVPDSVTRKNSPPGHASCGSVDVVDGTVVLVMVEVLVVVVAGGTLVDVLVLETTVGMDEVLVTVLVLVVLDPSSGTVVDDVLVVRLVVVRLVEVRLVEVVVGGTQGAASSQSASAQSVSPSQSSSTASPHRSARGNTSPSHGPQRDASSAHVCLPPAHCPTSRVAAGPS
jgi:hypothetical protein